MLAARGGGDERRGAVKLTRLAAGEYRGDDGVTVVGQMRRADGGQGSRINYWLVYLHGVLVDQHYTLARVRESLKSK